jgi:hypothetical protein
MKSLHEMDTPRNVTKTVGAVIALLVLTGVILTHTQASLIIGGMVVVGFLALVAWEKAIKAKRESKS